MKKHLFALLALVCVLAGCPTGSSSTDDGGLRIPDATPGLDGGHRVGSFNPTPTGTGLPHIVSGVQQAAASLVVDADVSASAAIAGTKISPVFGAQDVTTSTGVAIGATPAATGDVRLQGISAIKFLRAGSDYNALSISAGSFITLGDNTSNEDMYMRLGSGGTYRIITTSGHWAFNVYPTTTSITTAYPITGEQGESSPYSVHGKITISTAPPLTLSNTQYWADAVMFSSATAGTYTFPTPASDAAAYYKTVINTGAGTKTLSDGAGSTPTLAVNLSGRFLFDTAGVHLTGATVAYP